MFGGEPFSTERVLSENPVILIYVFCFSIFQSSNSFLDYFLLFLSEEALNLSTKNILSSAGISP